MADRIEVPQIAIMQGLRTVIKILIEKYEDLGMKASGDWAAELEPIVDGNRGLIMGLDYTEYLTKGRMPGLPPKTQIIMDWMETKGGFDYENDKQHKSIAIAIAKKIGKSGTKNFQKGGTDLLEVLNTREVSVIFNDAIKVSLIAQITEILRREVKEVEVKK